MIYNGYIWFADSPTALQNITLRTSSLSDAQHYYNSRKFYYRKNALEGYISLSQIVEEYLPELDQQDQFLYDYIVGDKLDNQSFSLEGSYEENGLHIKAYTAMPHNFQSFSICLVLPVIILYG